jgi:hypothetical protein
MLTEEEKRVFMRGLPARVSVGDLASMWMVMAIAYRLSPDELSAALRLLTESVESGRYNVSTIGEVKH